MNWKCMPGHENRMNIYNRYMFPCMNIRLPCQSNCSSYLMVHTLWFSNYSAVIAPHSNIARIMSIWCWRLSCKSVLRPGEIPTDFEPGEPEVELAAGGGFFSAYGDLIAVAIAIAMSPTDFSILCICTWFLLVYFGFGGLSQLLCLSFSRFSAQNCTAPCYTCLYASL